MGKENKNCFSHLKKQLNLGGNQERQTQIVDSDQLGKHGLQEAEPGQEKGVLLGGKTKDGKNWFGHAVAKHQTKGGPVYSHRQGVGKDVEFMTENEFKDYMADSKSTVTLVKPVKKRKGLFG